jgi:hypothetical protein
MTSTKPRTIPSMKPEGDEARAVRSIRRACRNGPARPGGAVADRERRERALALWRMQQFYEQLCVPRDIPARQRGWRFCTRTPGCAAATYRPWRSRSCARHCTVALDLLDALRGAVEHGINGIERPCLVERDFSFQPFNR